jgi:hypothetical protein
MRSATGLALATTLTIAALLAPGAGSAFAQGGCPDVTVSGGGSTVEGGTVPFTISGTFDSLCQTFGAMVPYSTSDGSACECEDYAGASGTADINSDSGPTDVTVATSDDEIDEPSEDFSLEAGGSSAGATIQDNDDPPSLSIAPVSVPEGTGAPGVARFRAELSGPSGFPISVGYQTADGTATAGSDYTPTNGTLRFGPGDTSDTITVPIAADSADEPDEAFAIVLSNGDHVSLDTSQTTGTIRDDDATPPGQRPPTGPTPPVPPPIGGDPGSLLPPTPGQADTVPPKIAVSVPVVRNGVVQWIVTCPVTEQICRGIVRLTTAGKVKASAAAKKKRKKSRRVSLGNKTYVLTGGQAKKISLKVNKRGRALVRKRKKVKVRATFTTKDSAGNKVKRSQTFTLHEIAFRHN